MRGTCSSTPPSTTRLRVTSSILLGKELGESGLIPGRLYRDDLPPPPRSCLRAAGVSNARILPLSMIATIDHKAGRGLLHVVGGQQDRLSGTVQLAENLHRARRRLGSRPAVGSSMKSTGRAVKDRRATISRSAIPPEIAQRPRFRPLPDSSRNCSSRSSATPAGEAAAEIPRGARGSRGSPTPSAGGRGCRSCETVSQVPSGERRIAILLSRSRP